MLQLSHKASFLTPQLMELKIILTQRHLFRVIFYFLIHRLSHGWKMISGRKETRWNVDTFHFSYHGKEPGTRGQELMYTENPHEKRGTQRTNENFLDCWGNRVFHWRQDAARQTFQFGPTNLKKWTSWHRWILPITTSLFCHKVGELRWDPNWAFNKKGFINEKEQQNVVILVYHIWHWMIK